MLELQRVLLRSQVGEAEWANTIMANAMQPLVEIAGRPSTVLANLSYSVQIHLNERLSVDGNVIDVHRVETLQRARRLLPRSRGRSHMWVSIARNTELIKNEFFDPNCLAREIVEFDATWDDERWARAAKELCSARIIIDGVTKVAVTKHPDDITDPLPPGLLRWYFPSDLDGAGGALRRPSTVAIDYPMRATQNSMPMLFSSYYCMGSLSLSLAIYGSMSHDVELRCQPFLAQALDRPVDVTPIQKDGLCRQILITTGDQTLLWPGSGVSVWWEPTAMSEGASGGGVAGVQP